MDKILQKILEWNKSEYIDYPWRAESNYFLKVIAELLLKRTTAQALRREWSKIVDLKDSKSVINMSDDEIVQKIKNLGLYEQRLSHIKNVARADIEKPIYLRSKEELLEIEGIGEYISSAIRVLVFNKYDILIDSNIERIISRISGYGKIPKIKDLLSKSHLIKIKPREVFISLLDFSKKVCTPTSPKCNNCPIRKECKYYKKTKQTPLG